MTLTCEIGANFSITPGSHDFGSVHFNTTTPEFVFTITNIGAATSKPATAQVFGHGVFSIGGTDTCGTLTSGVTLAPGASCTVGVVFNPAGHFNYTGILVFSELVGTAADEGYLSGTGVTTP